MQNRTTISEAEMAVAMENLRAVFQRAGCRIDGDRLLGQRMNFYYRWVDVNKPGQILVATTKVAGLATKIGFATFLPRKMILGFDKVACLVCGEGGLNDVSAYNADNRLVASGRLEIIV